MVSPTLSAATNEVRLPGRKRDELLVVAGNLRKTSFSPVVFRLFDPLERARCEVPFDVTLAVECRATQEHHPARPVGLDDDRRLLAEHEHRASVDATAAR